MPLLSFKNKIEIFFTGARYLRYLFILSILLLDFVIFSEAGPTLNVYEMVAYTVQILCIAIFALARVLGFLICRSYVHYTFAFMISELIVEICVSPALIIGSLLGIIRKKGSFYRTQRIGDTVKGI